MKDYFTLKSLILFIIALILAFIGIVVIVRTSLHTLGIIIVTIAYLFLFASLFDNLKNIK